MANCLREVLKIQQTFHVYWDNRTSIYLLNSMLWMDMAIGLITIYSESVKFRKSYQLLGYSRLVKATKLGVTVNYK